MGWLSDVTNGKEKTVKKDALAGEINAAGATGLGTLRDGAARATSIYSQDPTQIVRNQIGMENKVARTAADDATRRTRELIAQRGMGTSSIGLGAQVNERKSLMDRIGMNNAGYAGRLRDMQLQNAEGLMETGNNLYGLKAQQGIQMTSQKYRTGGYANLIAPALQGFMSGVGKGAVQG